MDAVTVSDVGLCILSISSAVKHAMVLLVVDKVEMVSLSLLVLLVPHYVASLIWHGGLTPALQGCCPAQPLDTLSIVQGAQCAAKGLKCCLAQCGLIFCTEPEPVYRV